MEGMNIGAMMLSAIVVLVAGLALLIAIGALLAGNYKLARLVFASGMLASAVLAAVVSLSYLQDVRRSSPRGAGLIFITSAAVLLIAGWGQFRAATVFPGRYLLSLALSMTAVGLVTVVVSIGELYEANTVSKMKFDGKLAIMIMIFGIGLAVASCMVALPPKVEQPPGKGKRQDEV